jgi:hypothetical protein
MIELLLHLIPLLPKQERTTSHRRCTLDACLSYLDDMKIKNANDFYSAKKGRGNNCKIDILIVNKQNEV